MFEIEKAASPIEPPKNTNSENVIAYRVVNHKIWGGRSLKTFVTSMIFCNQTG